MEESFQKDFADLNSERMNVPKNNENENDKNNYKNSDKIYEIQKIILMLRVCGLKLHVQKFRDSKIESKDNVFMIVLNYLYKFKRLL